MPFFSILMPAYQAESFIARAVDSLKGQSFSDWELIIVDDSSRDKTYEIALNYAKSDNRIKVYRNDKNLGQAQNWNVALGYVKGEWLGFLPCDDWFEPQALATIAKNIKETGAEIQIHAHYALHEKDGQKDLVRPIPNSVSGKLRKLAQIFYEKGNIFGEVSCYFVKRSLFTDTGIRFGKNCSTLDLEVWMKICLEHSESIYHYTPVILATTTIHPAADSSKYNLSGKNWLDFFQFYAKFSHVSWPLRTRLRQVPRLIYCYLRERKVIPESERPHAFRWLKHTLLNLILFRNRQLFD